MTAARYGAHARALLSSSGSSTDANSTAVEAASEHESGAVVLWFIFISLAIGSATRTALHGTSIPYTVVLFVLGMLIAVIYYYTDLGALDKSLDAWASINPHLLLACFLPALIFESSFSMEWHTLKKVLPKVLILAGPGVLISMALTGITLKVFPFGLSWGFCMMVGSILAATDPVAVVAILKEVGASKILGHTIEGESLVNDGTAIVVFNVFFAIAKGEHLTFGEIMTDLITQPLLSTVLGIGVGQACMIWLRNSYSDHLIDITITLFAGYISFMLAETVVHCSGVLTVVVLGWFLSAKGRTLFKGHIQHSMHHFWEMLTYAANTIVFILAGFLIIADILTGDLDIKGSDVGWGILLYLLINVIRLVTVAILYPFMNMFKGHKLTLREAVITIWAGLRGAVGLALALVVLEEHTHFSARERGITLAMISCTVIGTLLVNASTSAAMLRIVGLLTPGLSHDRALAAARKAIHERALQHYDEQLEQTGAQYLGAPDFTAVKQLVPYLRSIEETDDIEFSLELEKMDAQLMTEMRGRFLAGLTTEIWSMLEDDLIDSQVASALLVAIERAVDKACRGGLCDLDKFMRVMKESRTKSKMLKWFDRRKFGKQILKSLRYLRVIDEEWMNTRRQMQGLHALISAHRLTAEQFKALLGKNDEEKETVDPAKPSKSGDTKLQSQPSVASLAREFTIKKAIEQPHQNLANETSIKSNHVRDVIMESDEEVTRAVELLKEMQQAHNAVARSLRSEALAREILEVTMEETKLLTHTGLLDESEGSMLQSEHDTYLRRIIRYPLPPSRTSPGRILAAIPLFDFTQKVGINSRDLRKYYLREAEVVEFKNGDVVFAPEEKMRDGLLVVGNGVVRICDANSEDLGITAGCKSHPHAWALGLYEAMVNWRSEGEPIRSGLRAVAQAPMFGFIIPISIMDKLHEDPREADTVEYMWRTIVGLFAETLFAKGLERVLPDTSVTKLVRAGKLVNIAKGTKLEHDQRQVVLLLKGSVYNESVGDVPAPRLLTFKKCDMRTTAGKPESLEAKLESRLSALKFGKNGLVRASSQNLVALASIAESKSMKSTKETMEESISLGAAFDETLCVVEAATDLLLFVIPSDSKAMALTSLQTFKRSSTRSARKADFLKTLTRKLNKTDESTTSPAGLANERASPRTSSDLKRGQVESKPSPSRRLSLQMDRPQSAARRSLDDALDVEDPRAQHTADSMLSLGSDDHVQLTHMSDDIAPLRNWDDSPLNNRARTLPSRNYEDPSTQHTIS